MNNEEKSEIAATFGLSFGAMSKPISLQIWNQKLEFDEKVISHLQLDADALTRLRVRGILTNSAFAVAEKKLYHKIVLHVRKKNNL